MTVLASAPVVQLDGVVARDATSAIVLLLPAMESISIGAAWFTFCRNANARRSRPAVFDRLELIRCVQYTVGVLSQYMPAVLCFIYYVGKLLHSS